MNNLKSIINMEQFTKNFTYEELIESSTASRLKLKNIPNSKEKEKLRQLAIKILQPIRDKWGKPIIITSGFRSKLVNQAVGGSKTSQHALGEAADLKIGGITENRKLFDLIVQMIKNKEIEVGQLINEYNYSWIHISLPRIGKPNNQILSIDC